MYNIHNLNVKNIASDEESRFPLSCVRFTPTETQATDGHILVRVTVPEPHDYVAPNGVDIKTEFEPVLLHKEVVGKIKRAVDTGFSRDKNRLYPLGVSEDNQVSFLLQNLYGHSVFTSKVESTKFPDVDQVEKSVLGPDSKTETELSLNPILLKAVCEQFIGFVENTNPKIKLETFGKERPVVFSASRYDGQKMTVYLMPMRD